MVRLTFTGDIACDKPLLKAAKKGRKYDYSRVFQTDRVFSSSDFIIGNMETCFGAGHYGKKPLHYSTPDSFCDAVREAGFNVLGTANNHCLDEGVKGLKRTIDVIEKNGIAHTGTFRGEDNEKRYLIVEKNGLKIAFYSLTYSVNDCYEASSCEDASKYVNIVGFKKRTFSANPILRFWQAYLKPEIKQKIRKRKYGTVIPKFVDDLSVRTINESWLGEIDRQILEAKKESDILAVLLHSGGQFNTEPGSFSTFMVDHLCELGADIIAGHHPHTLQRMEQRGNTFIAYSLGGYCLSPSGEYLVKESLPEYSAAWHIDIDDNKQISGTSVTILKCVEDPDHYVHVVEAEDQSANIDAIRSRLGL